MPQVTIAVNNRLYQVGCEAGQEQHITRLASYVDAKVKELANQAGQVGDARLLLMASLLIADELADAYDDLEALRAQRAADAAKLRAAQQQAVAAPAASAEVERGRVAELKAAEERVAAGIRALAKRIDTMAERLGPA